MAAATLCSGGLSTTMLLYIVAQFATWAVHDGLQQYMFEQPGFAQFGVTMALCLQVSPLSRGRAPGRARCVARAPPDAPAPR